MEFMAEIVRDPSPTDTVVRFRYVIDGSAALALPRKWWDELGCPDTVFVEVKPDSETL